MYNIENNKRIAKNTMFLFFRMFFSLVIALFTTRIVLKELGVIDFGIYAVVGGIVLMMEFLKSSMSSSIQRFLSFEIGNKNYTRVKEVFSMSINIHLIIVFIIFVIAETIGLWFLNQKLIIPTERLNAANWVYQFSVLTFIVGVLNVSYNAIIISEEKMKIYAYMSILESFLKLVAVFFLIWTESDKLIMYSGLIFSISLIVFSFYIIYCKLKFPLIKYTFRRNNKLFYKLLKFAGWNLFGGLAGVAKGQGVNIILNLFFGPTVNAARAISFQVGGAINMFVTNFQVAINPQIIKSYAIEDNKYMQELIFRGSKFSFYLLYVMSLPILFETQFVLNIWLKNIPDYTQIFIRLIIINVLIDSLSGTLMTAAQASGKIKKYQMIIGGLIISILPFSYFFLQLDFPPQSTLYISICISVIALFSRLLLINKLVNVSIKQFLQEVLMRVLLVVGISLILPLIFKYQTESSFINSVLLIIISFLSIVYSIYIIGLDNVEKLFIKSKITDLLILLKKK